MSTFKPANLQNSPTLRALARQALADGFISPAEKTLITKQASTVEKPQNLTEKILALTDALRSQGLNSYASVIEKQFLAMRKTAANLHIYNVHNEEGKDLVEFAHPKGGTLLDKSWGDLGVIETIQEQQDAAKEMIAKKPTGKYASKNAINALRILLAQEAPPETNYDAKIKQIVAEGVSYATAIVNDIIRRDAYRQKTEGTGIVLQSILDDMKESLGQVQSLLGENLDYTNIMKIVSSIDEIFPSLTDSSYFMSGDGKEFLEKIKGYLDTAKARFNAAFELLKGKVQGAQYQLGLGIIPSKITIDSPTANTGEMSTEVLLQKVQADKAQAQVVSSQLTNLKSKPSISANPKRSAFVQAIEKAVFNYSSDLDKMISNLRELGDQPLPSITKATEGASLFEGATSYDKFKEIAISFHDAINARLKSMQKWV